MYTSSRHLPISKSGVTLSLKKYSFWKREVKFIGHVIDSEKSRAQKDKIKVVRALKVQKTTKQVIQFMGFFSYYRGFISNFGEIAIPTRDLIGEHVPNAVPWGDDQLRALKHLTVALCDSVMKPLYVIGCNQPPGLDVDANDYKAPILSKLADDSEFKAKVKACLVLSHSWPFVKIISARRELTCNPR